MYFVVNCENGAFSLAIVTNEDGETLLFSTRKEAQEFCDSNLNDFLIIKYY